MSDPVTETEVYAAVIGKTLRSVHIDRVENRISFTFENGMEYTMWHTQDCCEDVHIEDVVGNLEDLLGSPLVMAESVAQSGLSDQQYDGSSTWTFYKFATNKGTVTFRWLGTSNGYYSESVNFALE